MCHAMAAGRQPGASAGGDGVARVNGESDAGAGSEVDDSIFAFDQSYLRRGCKGKWGSDAADMTISERGGQGP